MPFTSTAARCNCTGAYNNQLVGRTNVIGRILVLIFVDTAKELPATLILRPFNFETLATTVYNYASLEQLAESGPAAIAIILVVLLPVAILARSLNQSRPGEEEQPLP